jgi:uncharacterized damage-inducible protein DinB
VTYRFAHEQTRNLAPLLGMNARRPMAFLSGRCRCAGVPGSTVLPGRVRIRRRRSAAAETRCPFQCGRARVNAVTESKDRETVPERWNAVGPASDMWMDAAQDPRFAAGTKLEDERATLLDYLRAYRLTMEMKCAGLDPAQLARRSVPPSTMSLLGLIRHMADVERNWFRRVMAQATAPPLYWSEDLEDADWAGAVADPAVVDDAWQAWRDEVAFAEKFVVGSPDLGIRGTMRDGDTIALREVLVHMIEEYARHCGHADLLRERIDGRVGQ